MISAISHSEQMLGTDNRPIICNNMSSSSIVNPFSTFILILETTTITRLYYQFSCLHYIASVCGISPPLSPSCGNFYSSIGFSIDNLKISQWMHVDFLQYPVAWDSSSASIKIPFQFTFAAASPKVQFLGLPLLSSLRNACNIGSVNL